MDRTACADLAAFPLQVLLRRRPEWRGRPVAVVDADRPQGRVLWVNERARRRGVLPGLRYAAGLSLEPDLRAAVVPPDEIATAAGELSRRLRRYTPRVEPVRDEPGVFFLDAGGLERIYPSLREWGRLVRTEIEGAGFRATIAVGFTRFGSLALARGRRGVLLVRDPAEERAAARGVSLDRLTLAPAVRDMLARLGVTTVGQFVDLPVEGLESRFGGEVTRLHRSASGDLRPPLQAELPRPPVLARHALDYAETDVMRLMLVVERLLPQVMRELAGRARALCQVEVGLRFDSRGDHIERIRPAAPTLDAGQVAELIRLRLGAAGRLPEGVVEVIVLARESEATPRQLELFARQPRRDLAAGDRALARVRAELGNDAVIRAELREGHLPEASFRFEPFDTLRVAVPRGAGDGRLVRRIHDRPQALPPRPRHEPDGWMLRGLDQGPVINVFGPYVVSGGWWRRAQHREYHFAETQKGELLWVYYDRPRRRWFVQGRVE